jgi:hypothetical protein
MWGTERRDTGRKQITEKLTSVLKEAKVVTWPAVFSFLKLSAGLGSHFLTSYCVVLELEWKIKIYILNNLICPAKMCNYCKREIVWSAATWMNLNKKLWLVKVKSHYNWRSV